MRVQYHSMTGKRKFEKEASIDTAQNSQAHDS